MIRIMTDISDNSDAGRFELIEQGHTAYAEYRQTPDRIFVDSVSSPPALRGAGTAGRLMQGVVEAARERAVTITPVCGYAASWLKRHPETADLL